MSIAADVKHPRLAIRGPAARELWAWPDERTGLVTFGRVRRVGLYRQASGVTEGVSFAVMGQRKHPIVRLADLLCHGRRMAEIS